MLEASFLVTLLLIYGLIILQTGKYKEASEISFFLGGGFTPHALHATRSGAFLFVTILFYFLFLGMALLPIVLPYEVWVPPVVGACDVVLFYLILAGILSLRTCANAEVEHASQNAPPPETAFPDELYPFSIIGYHDEAALMPLLQHSTIAPNLQTTILGDGIRQMPTSFVIEARRALRQVWVQPLHPEVGKRIMAKVEELTASSHAQAAKSLDAIKEADHLRSHTQQLQANLQELQQSNEMLNSKLLSMRTRTRGASGDFKKMSAEELDAERDRMMDALRRLDDERRSR